jgi:hypothetical protein
LRCVQSKIGRNESGQALVQLEFVRIGSGFKVPGSGFGSGFGSRFEVQFTSRACRVGLPLGS